MKTVIIKIPPPSPVDLACLQVGSVTGNWQDALNNKHAYNKKKKLSASTFFY